MFHYALTYEEARQRIAATGGNDWIDRGDFNALPARAAICRTGDGHAKVIRDWSKVTCDRCLALAPADAIIRNEAVIGGARITMGDGSVWHHPYGGGAPVREA